MNGVVNPQYNNKNSQNNIRPSVETGVDAGEASAWPGRIGPARSRACGKSLPLGRRPFRGRAGLGYGEAPQSHFVIDVATVD